MTIERMRYPSRTDQIAVRNAALHLSIHGDYEKARVALQYRAVSKPWLLAIRMGALCGKLAEEEGSGGLDKYVGFANWIASEIRLEQELILRSRTNNRTKE